MSNHSNTHVCAPLVSTNYMPQRRGFFQAKEGIKPEPCKSKQSDQLSLGMSVLKTIQTCTCTHEYSNMHTHVLEHAYSSAHVWTYKLLVRGTVYRCSFPSCTLQPRTICVYNLRGSQFSLTRNTPPTCLRIS